MFFGFYSCDEYSIMSNKNIEVILRSSQADNENGGGFTNKERLCRFVRPKPENIALRGQVLVEKF